MFRDVISLAGNVISWQSTGCRQHTLPRTTFSHAQLLHSTDDMCALAQGPCRAQVTKHIVCVSPKNTHNSSRNVVHFAALDDTTHGHSFLTFSWTSLPESRTTLRISTATAEWRFDGTTTLYNLRSSPIILCQEIAFSEFFFERRSSIVWKTQHQGQHPKLRWKVSGMCSSSSSSLFAMKS